MNHFTCISSFLPPLSDTIMGDGQQKVPMNQTVRRIQPRSAVLPTNLLLGYLAFLQNMQDKKKAIKIMRASIWQLKGKNNPREKEKKIVNDILGP